MRYGLNVPNLAEFHDPRQMAALAATAEASGWDGVFIWDHVDFGYAQDLPVADPWVLLTSMALATERIRLGPLVTPVPRRRPGTLARQTTSVDRLSNGRLVFGAGLGFTIEAEYGSWGVTDEPPVLAERLDEGLDLLASLWSGEPVTYRGTHLSATDVTFQPTPLQRPRPPVWIGCNWPNQRPLRRAARWDGVAPMIVDETGMMAPTPERVATMLATIERHRTSDAPFDTVITGRTSPDRSAAELANIAEIEAAGATWWLEGFYPAPGEYAAALRTAEVGPPR